MEEERSNSEKDVNTTFLPLEMVIIREHFPKKGGLIREESILRGDLFGLPCLHCIVSLSVRRKNDTG